MGLGGSDMGTILGLNKYFSKLELFYQKIGMNFEAEEDSNVAAAMGQVTEDNILMLGSHYDTTSGEWLDNWRHGVIEREIKHFPYMVRNTDYPWMIANIDGAINPVTKRKITTMERIAEAKMISRQSADMWESRIPPYHIAQQIMYQLVLSPILEYDESYIFYLEDGTKFSMVPVAMADAPNIRDELIEESYKFWVSILKGKEILDNEKNEALRDKGLSELEPEPDDTERYRQFLSKLFIDKESRIEIEGTDEVFDWGIKYQEYNERKKEFEAKKSEAQNNILKFMRDNQAGKIDFGTRGHITYNKRLYVSCLDL